MDEDVIVTLRYAVVMETDAKCAAAAAATARYTRATNRNAQLLCYCRRATRRANKSQLIPSTLFLLVLFVVFCLDRPYLLLTLEAAVWLVGHCFVGLFFI